jgi:hypothetical protein
MLLSRLNDSRKPVQSLLHVTKCAAQLGQSLHAVALPVTVHAHFGWSSVRATSLESDCLHAMLSYCAAQSEACSYAAEGIAVNSTTHMLR